MENKIIVAIILLIAGLLGVGHLIQPAHLQFREVKDNDFYKQKFEEFQWKYEKVYNDEKEESIRFALFKKAMIYIEEYNSKHNDLKLAMNTFGDLTDAEFEQKYLTRISTPEHKKVYAAEKPLDQDRPKKVDWIGTLVWNQVRNQGSCGSCWAHSAAQSLEGAYAKATGKFRKLSIQELVDCVYPKEDTCTNGGMEQEGMAWTIKNGICAEEDYPRLYNEKQMTCEKDKCKPLLTNIEKSIYLPRGDTNVFLNYLAVAPISIAINASAYEFRYYHNGIIKGATSKSLNHAVLAVGYDETESYTKGKNSWGADWGENGYFRVAIVSGGGPIGIYQEPSFPVYKGEPVPTF